MRLAIFLLALFVVVFAADATTDVVLSFTANTTPGFAFVSEDTPAPVTTLSVNYIGTSAPEKVDLKLVEPNGVDAVELKATYYVCGAKDALVADETTISVPLFFGGTLGFYSGRVEICATWTHTTDTLMTETPTFALVEGEFVEESSFPVTNFSALTFSTDTSATTTNIKAIVESNTPKLLATSLKGVEEKYVNAVYKALYDVFVTDEIYSINSVADVIADSAIRAAIVKAVEASETDSETKTTVDASVFAGWVSAAANKMSDETDPFYLLDAIFAAVDDEKKPFFAQHLVFDDTNDDETMADLVTQLSFNSGEMNYLRKLNFTEKAAGSYIEGLVNYVHFGQFYAEAMTLLLGAFKTEPALPDTYAHLFADMLSGEKLLGAIEITAKDLVSEVEKTKFKAEVAIAQTCASISNANFDLNSSFKLLYQGEKVHSTLAARNIDSFEDVLEAVSAAASISTYCSHHGVTVDFKADAVVAIFLSKLSKDEEKEMKTALVKTPLTAEGVLAANAKGLYDTENEDFAKLPAVYGIDFTNEHSVDQLVDAFYALANVHGGAFTETAAYFTAATAPAPPAENPSVPMSAALMLDANTGDGEPNESEPTTTATDKHFLEHLTGDNAADFTYAVARYHGVYPCDYENPNYEEDVQKAVDVLCSCKDGEAIIFGEEIKCGEINPGHFGYKPADAKSESLFEIACPVGTKQPLAGQTTCQPCKSDEVCTTAGTVSPAWKYTSSFDPSTKSGKINIAVTVVVVALALIGAGVGYHFYAAKKHARVAPARVDPANEL